MFCTEWGTVEMHQGLFFLVSCQEDFPSLSMPETQQEVRGDLYQVKSNGWSLPTIQE